MTRRKKKRIIRILKRKALPYLLSTSIWLGINFFLKTLQKEKQLGWGALLVLICITGMFFHDIQYKLKESLGVKRRKGRLIRDWKDVKIVSKTLLLEVCNYAKYILTYFINLSLWTSLVHFAGGEKLRVIDIIYVLWSWIFAMVKMNGLEKEWKQDVSQMWRWLRWCMGCVGVLLMVNVVMFLIIGALDMIWVKLHIPEYIVMIVANVLAYLVEWGIKGKKDIVLAKRRL